MIISPNHHAHPLSQQFVEAAHRSGLGAHPTYNGGAYDGAWVCELAHKGGQRFSAYDAYLKPAMQRANLEVVTGAHATRILIEGGRAAGVAIRRDGVEQTFAARGVVLAAGAFGSPQLLMLSGVGPVEELARLGIGVHCDAPEVGANLQDHPLGVTVFRTRRTDTMKNAESLLSLLQYVLFKRGMLASNAIEAFAFTNVRGEPSSAPDLELIFTPLEWRNEGLESPKIHAFSIASVAVAPRSRGCVSLTSADPLAPPVVDFGLLSDPDDIDAAVMLEGIRLIRKIVATEPLASETVGEIYPGESIQKDDDLRASVNAVLQTVYHPTSTCRMGSDRRAVVDSELRVLGVEGLWVADASVMPSVPRGHPNAVVAMIAHRAADWIEPRLTP
jgi:choline dehydrogenase-like flavoprotein